MTHPLEPEHDTALADAIRSNPMWYHTMELHPGVVTPGWFDLRPVIGDLPWPDVRGKRCLDIGTYDGFLAFEMERRGAAEVVATDIGAHDDWDYPPAVRAGGVRYLNEYGGEKGRGFDIAAQALRSSVKKTLINVYDLSPSSVGEFDVVVCGTLLLHLRDPFRALEAIRSVCRGVFMSTEQIELALSIVYRRMPLTTLSRIDLCQWHVPNLAGHRQMIKAAGFEIVRAPRPYSVPFGSGHPPLGAGPLRKLVGRVATGRYGLPHSAVLARPLALH